jgi:hypothetical protein
MAHRVKEEDINEKLHSALSQGPSWQDEVRCSSSFLCSSFWRSKQLGMHCMVRGEVWLGDRYFRENVL